MLRYRRPILLALFASMNTLVGLPQESQAELGKLALSTVRLINTAEADAHHDRGKYLALRELASSRVIKQAAALNKDSSTAHPALNITNEGEPLAGFDLGLIVSADGEAYKLSLLQKKNCGIVYFSDERAIIYEGKALGCQ